MPDMLRELFVRDTPLLDVRAEVEFARGAFPTAVNLPILNDDERHRVGICYKEEGPDAAVALGHQLVTGDIRAQRIAAWREFIDSHPDAHLYCFRGGQRSGIAAQWLDEAGIRIPRIEGGYKQMRRFLLETFDNLPELMLLSGRTGVGKTRVLDALKPDLPDAIIDLEGRANHRGSAFGKYLTPQPTQINFENSLAIDFLKSGERVLLEDESNMIGRINLPLPLQAVMGEAPIVLLQARLDERVALIREEYVEQRWQTLRHELPEEQAFERIQEHFLGALDGIRRRLGGANHQALRRIMVDAFERQRHDDFGGHDAWIETLLKDYYDPMYDYQLEKRTGRIVFRGSLNEVMAYASEKLPATLPVS